MRTAQVSTILTDKWFSSAAHKIFQPIFKWFSFATSIRDPRFSQLAIRLWSVATLFFFFCCEIVKFFPKPLAAPKSCITSIKTYEKFQYRSQAQAKFVGILFFFDVIEELDWELVCSHKIPQITRLFLEQGFSHYQPVKKNVYNVNDEPAVKRNTTFMKKVSKK